MIAGHLKLNRVWLLFVNFNFEKDFYHATRTSIAES